MKEEIRKVIRMAIKREQGAYRMYCVLLKKTRDFNTQTLFRQIGIEELKHEALLEEFLKTQNFETAKKNVALQHINNEFNIVDHLTSASESFEITEGFQRAIEKEHKAAEFYEKHFKQAESEDIKDIFYYLAEEEKKHERLLRMEYQKFIG